MRGGTHRRAGLHSTVPQTTVTADHPERTRLIQVHLRRIKSRHNKSSETDRFTCAYVCVSVRSPYLVEPEIVRLQKRLKFGEKLVVVKAIDGLYITGTVVQVTCDLRQMENTNTGLSSEPFVQKDSVELSIAHLVLSNISQRQKIREKWNVNLCITTFFFFSFPLIISQSLRFIW